MLDENSDRKAWEAQLRAALVTDDPFMTKNWRCEKGELEWIEKNPAQLRLLVIKDTWFHGLYQQGLKLFPKAKCLFVVRNPCGHLNSWRKSKEFPAGQIFVKEWRYGECRKSEGPGEYWGFEDWKKLASEFLELERSNPKGCWVFRYEDLVADPVEMTQTLFNFVGQEMHPDVSSFIERSHATHDPNVFSIFRSPAVAESWRKEFPKEISREVYQELSGSDLERFIQ